MPTIQTVLCIGNVFVQFLKQNFNHIYFYRKTLMFYSQVTLYPQNVFTFSCLVFTCVSGSRFPSADFVNLRVASVFFWPSAPAQGFTPFPALPAWVEGRLGCFLNASETGGLTWYPEVHKDIVHIKNWFNVNEVKSKFFILKNHIWNEGCFSFSFHVVILKSLLS